MKQILTILFISLVLSANAQTYGTSSINWTTNGNRVLERNFLGTTSNHPLKLYSNGNPAAYFDTDQSLYLLQVPEVYTDSVIGISNGQITKMAYDAGETIEARNGLNRDHDSKVELGGNLIRPTTINTDAHALLIQNNKAYNTSNFSGANLSAFTSVHPDQNTSYRSFNMGTNFNDNPAVDFDATRGFLYYNTYTEIAPPGFKFTEPIINQGVLFSKAVHGQKADTIFSAINQSIVSIYDSWSGQPVPFVDRYINTYTGYNLPYYSNSSENEKFGKRIELLINPAPDNAPINSIDIFISNGDVSAYEPESGHIPTGTYGIYQNNAKDNVLHGSLELKKGLKLPNTVLQDEYNDNVPGSIFYDDVIDKLQVVASDKSILTLLSQSTAATIAAPTGGSTVDVEARAALNQILNALIDVGILTP